MGVFLCLSPILSYLCTSENTDQTPIKATKYILRLIVGLLSTVCLSLLLLTSHPAFQTWGAEKISLLLSERTGSRVTVGRLRLSLPGRVILDNVRLYDRRDTLMLQASRIAAKISLLPLMEKRLHIDNAQLIGARVVLYKDGDEPCNFQYLVDAFSSTDTTSAPLSIGALLMRRCELRYDHIGQPRTPGRLNPAHLHLKDLTLTARILSEMPDTLALDLRNLSFSEQSGLQLRHLSLQAEAGRHSLALHDLKLELPATTLTIPTLASKHPSHPTARKPRGALFQKDWREATAPLAGTLTARISPSDLQSIIPGLSTFSDHISLSTNIQQKDSTLQLTSLNIADDTGNISLLCNLTLTGIHHTPDLHADITELRTGSSVQQFLTRNLQEKAREASTILTYIGSTKTSGTISLRDNTLQAKTQTRTEQGSNLDIDATLHDMQRIEARLSVTNLNLSKLLHPADTRKNTTLTLETTLSGNLPGKDKQTALTATGTLKSLIYRGYEHRNINFTATIDGDAYSAQITKEEPNGTAHLQLQTTRHQGSRTLQCNAQVKDLAPWNMNLTERYEGERFSGNLKAEFSNIDPRYLQGNLHLTDIELTSDRQEPLHIGNITLSSQQEENNSQHLQVQSDFLNIKADGNILWQNLAQSFLHPVRQNLPSLFRNDKNRQQPAGNDFHFLIQAKDTILIERLLGTNLHLPDKSTLEGTISDAVGQIALQLHIPRLTTSGQRLQDIDCRIESHSASLQASLQCKRIIKGNSTVEVNLDAYAKDDKVTSRLSWDNKRDIAYTGDISLTCNIQRDLSSHTAINAALKASDIIVGDTTWHIKPATISYHDGVIDIKDFSVSQAERHISINGRISDHASDSLKAELADIDLAYIMDLFNVRNIDFAGDVTGNIYGTSLMKHAQADAYLQVKDFTFNTARLGNMDLYANWGKQERAILLEADMRGPTPQHHTQLHGTIIPGNGKNDGLNLNIQTNHIDLTFLSKYTSNILSNLQGSASGQARIFGPFKAINLEGDMFINELKTHVIALNTDYQLYGDSVTMRPDNIWLRNATIYDNMGIPGMNEHIATLDMHLKHENFKNMSYDFNVEAYNILCYDTSAQGGSNFYGTVYADAEMHMQGEPGKIDINVSATPMPGTTIIYNVSTPGAVDETEFVTYVSLSDTAQAKTADIQTAQEKTSDDLRINFDIDVNPNAQILLIMDPATGDNITLNGNGRMLANYYNKGRFQLFGTYRVSEGSYRMSIRDLIRRDFTFMPDGTIIFGGDAMQAALNLKAKHTVHNVSLDDLSTTGLGLSNTRVDCIMNISGIAREPVISFDFDIPNANEDEKQMVRSMLSSNEERDMQTIYLLGVGRFYSYGTVFEKNQTQGSMAMNSMLSSVLSSRFNQIMSQALGGSNWSFGTNLQTGQVGWEQLDVEGMLSGRMLSGRLLFNGNFGYRESKYNTSQSNFIGDFDIQYKLSPRSPFSLKAYSLTNDRYFTQSSLTTQGIGIQFQRDFNRWKGLFHRASKKNNKKKK
ncbi:MAG: translocation/assembly module TamB domain-containing protein [Prevotellaceae bacterium]|nr:translocation/assembly module TamB domain-containing protein [Prevotellaceae bacterium]